MDITLDEDDDEGEEEEDDNNSEEEGLGAFEEGDSIDDDSPGW
jgi:hypothetical protein